MFQWYLHCVDYHLLNVVTKAASSRPGERSWWARLVLSASSCRVPYALWAQSRDLSLFGVSMVFFDGDARMLAWAPHACDLAFEFVLSLGFFMSELRYVAMELWQNSPLPPAAAGPGVPAGKTPSVLYEVCLAARVMATCEFISQAFAVSVRAGPQQGKPHAGPSLDV